MLQKDQNEAWEPANLDLEKFKAKMKHMARMVADYPELEGKLGDMREAANCGMYAQYVVLPEGQRRIELGYNPAGDRKGFVPAPNNGYTATDASYAGVHELGHGLNFLALPASNNRNALYHDIDTGYTADQMIQTALRRADGGATPNLYETHQSNVMDARGWVRHWRNQVNYSTSRLHEKNMTSGYGGTSAMEFFAEAFADVYAHGENARKASIELVKEYESRRDAAKKSGQEAGGGSGTGP